MDYIQNILPEIYLAVLALLTLVRGMLTSDTKKQNSNAFWAAFIGLFAVLMIYLFAVDKIRIMEALPIGPDTYLFTSYNLTVYIKILILMCSLSMLFLLREEQSRTKNKNYEYYFLIMLITLGACLAVSSFNLIVIYLGIELMSFSLFGLIGSLGLKIKREKALGRYFVMSAMATGIFLYGISILYLQNQSVDLGKIGEKMLLHSNASDFKNYFGVTLVIIGLVIKLGVFPLQYYLPEIAKHANRVALGLILTIVKIVAVVSLFHLLVITGVAEDHFLLVVTIASVGIISSSIICFREINLDRFIAYSSVHNICFVLICLALLGHSLFIYYLVVYILIVLALLCYLTSFFMNGETIRTTQNLAFCISKNPIDKLVTITLLLIISGLPPLGMFLGKFLVVKTLLYQGKYFFAAVIAIGGIIMIGAFLKLMKNLLVVGNVSSQYVVISQNRTARLLSATALICGLIFSVVFFGHGY